MLFGCIVTNLKSTFDSPVCEFTAKTGEGGIVSRCRCNIFTIGNRFAGNAVCFCSSCIRKSFAFSPLKPCVQDAHHASRLMLCPCFKSTTSALKNTRIRARKYGLSINICVM